MTNVGRCLPALAALLVLTGAGCAQLATGERLALFSVSDVEAATTAAEGVDEEHASNGDESSAIEGTIESQAVPPTQVPRASTDALDSEWEAAAAVDPNVTGQGTDVDWKPTVGNGPVESWESPLATEPPAAAARAIETGDGPESLDDAWVSAKGSDERPPAEPSSDSGDSTFELPESSEADASKSSDEPAIVDAVEDGASGTVRPVSFAAPPLPVPGVLPPPTEHTVPFAPHAPGIEYVEACQVVEPVFEQVVIAQPDRCWCGPCSPWKKLFKFQTCDGSTDLGIGRKRLPYAPFEIESAQPGNNVTLRYDMAYGMDRPDRSEYFWAQQGDSPPLNEREVDYQQLRIIREAGSGRFSLTTEYPIRFLDPDVNDNTAGIGDINIAPKIVLVDGKDWQLAHVFRTYIPTGSKRKGLGTGHVSLEPGALLRYAWTEDTNVFGQLKFWFPIGGDPGHSGPVCVYGFGWATNLCDSDTFAMIGTVEMTGVSYLDALATNSAGALVSNDSDTSFNLQPGMRFVLGPSGDLGLFELGVSTGHALSINGQYEHQVRLDLRWSY